jgi:pilus assembly protein Flp/PilA
MASARLCFEEASMREFSRRLRQRCSRMRDDQGATAVEYGLMVGLIAVVIIGAVTVFGLAVGDLFIIPADVFN